MEPVRHIFLCRKSLKCAVRSKFFYQCQPIRKCAVCFKLF